LQFIQIFKHGLRYKGPIFVLLGRLLGLLIDAIKLIERDLIAELIIIEDPDLDDPLCTFVGPIGGLAVAFAVDGVEFGHLEQHGVLLVDFVLLDVVFQLLLSLHLLLLVSF